MKVTMKSAPLIQRYIFENCNSLISVDMPKCLSIGDRAFIGCNSYMTVNFVSIPNPAILTHIYFPYVLIVFVRTFSNLTELASCRLPMITKIGSNLFRDHHRLTEVLLPSEIEGDSAFSGYESLTLISLQSLKTVNRNSMD